MAVAYVVMMLLLVYPAFKEEQLLTVLGLAWLPRLVSRTRSAQPCRFPSPQQRANMADDWLVFDNWLEFDDGTYPGRRELPKPALTHQEALPPY